MTSDLPTLSLSNIGSMGTSGNVIISGVEEKGASTSILNVRTDFHSVGIHANATDTHRLSVNGNVKTGDIHSKKITLRYDELGMDFSTTDIDANYGMIMNIQRGISDYNIHIKEGANDLLKLSSNYLIINSDLVITRSELIVK